MVSIKFEASSKLSCVPVSSQALDIALVKPTIHGDDRGYFLETFRQDLFEDFIGEKVGFIQDNESKSNKGVLRGLHYQIPPYEQAKLVRVIKIFNGFNKI
jgi:dTDP-4-dehydrorhamnose 3,5-epimerase